MSITQSVWQQGPWANSLDLTDATAAVAGTGILITASVAGEVVLTWARGGTITVTVAVGDNIYPFSVTTFHASGATVTRAANLSP